MITLDIERLCQIKGIDKTYAFLYRNGFTHRVSHLLASGAKKSIRLDHLERLCRILHCAPQDLLNYKPTGRGIDPTNDVLLPLRKAPLRTKSLNSLLASLPPEEILRVTAELNARFQPPASEPEPGQ